MKYQVQLFWDEVVRNGPMGLTRHDWSTIDHKLDDVSRAVLGRFLASIEKQTKWVEEQRRAMRDEAARIALVGETMRKAGLRSYTDEKGRIFVARTRLKESDKR